MNWRKILVVLAVIIIAAALWLRFFFDPAKIAQSRFKDNTALIEEQLAYHYGVLAYLYGYPLVDMHQQLHNETHKVSVDQQVYAPVNRFYRFPELIVPETAGNLRAPNNDTLYFSGWIDISENPVILHTPDTNDRYFTIAVTNQYSEVQHLGRSTTGTKETLFYITNEQWEGKVPAGMQHITVETPKAWLLGRLLVDGQEDLSEAQSLLNDFWLASSIEGQPGVRPPLTEVSQATQLQTQDSLDFFTLLNQELKQVPAREDEIALVAQFNEIGIGPDHELIIDELSEATKAGLLRAIEDGKEIVKASGFREIKSYNGWMISKDIGVYGHQYMHRAAVVKGGYGNLPEESLYPAALFDSEGKMLQGSEVYSLHFEANNLPPVNAFWSIAAYTYESRLEKNNLERYSIGDRTKGLQYADDGSLTLYFSHQPPVQGETNWLPTPKGRYFLVTRLYQPSEEVLNFEYQLPQLNNTVK